MYNNITINAFWLQVTISKLCIFQPWGIIATIQARWTQFKEATVPLLVALRPILPFPGAGRALERPGCKAEEWCQSKEEEMHLSSLNRELPSVYNFRVDLYWLGGGRYWRSMGYVLETEIHSSWWHGWCQRTADSPCKFVHSLLCRTGSWWNREENVCCT